MINDPLNTFFAKSAEEWICDRYSASIRFIARIDVGNTYILEAVIALSPLPPNIDNSFLIKTDKLFLGQIEIIQANKNQLLKIIEDAVAGTIDTPEGKIVLEKETKYYFYTEGSRRDIWFHQLHLAIVGRSDHVFTDIELVGLDNSLRIANPPFDGLNDVIYWLGLGSVQHGNNNPSIDIRINPPLDFQYDKCSLNNDLLEIAIVAHPLFNADNLQIAVRAVPGDQLNSRLQIASKLSWAKKEEDLLLGTATINIKNSDNVLVMLMLGGSIVRRHWFVDPAKARNNRLVAVQCYDDNLKRIKDAVFDSSDPNKFENGVAALLFLLGYSPCVQLETDSPDLIVQTPKGRIILIECTLKISDFSSKIGKLVDRKQALISNFEKSGHAGAVSSALICRRQKEQIATRQDELKSHKIILYAQEDLEAAFDQIRYHNDPDKIIEEAESALISDDHSPFGLDT